MNHEMMLKIQALVDGELSRPEEEALRRRLSKTATAASSSSVSISLRGIIKSPNPLSALRGKAAVRRIGAPAASAVLVSQG